jgi:hypothetical protein
MKKWLFNPFEIIAGGLSLLIGFIVVIVTAIAAYFTHTHLDGVIDLHIGHEINFSECISEGLIDWLTLSLLLYISGLIFSKSRIRIIDVFGTQGMARFPFLLAVIFSFFLLNDHVLKFIEYKFLKMGPVAELSTIDVMLFILGTFITILCLIWMIVLMYRSYSVSCNVKGNKGLFSFTGCLIIAEIFSKLFINLIF